MRTRIARRNLALDMTLTVDFDVTPDFDRAAHVDPCRVDERHTVRHEFARAQPAIFGFDLGELDFVVNTENLCHGRRDERCDPHAVGNGHGDDVGQIILALSIGITQISEPAT
jgi:hypothetical protein